MGVLSDLLKSNSAQTKNVLDSVSEPVKKGSFILESDVYPVKIKDAYAFTSKGGALGVRLILGYGDGYAKEYREDLYISNKNKESTYIDQKSGKERPLPGFATLNEICWATVQKPLSEVSTNCVEQMKKVYDFESKKEVNESHETYVDLIDTMFIAGIVKQEEPKNEKGSDGQYHATNEMRTVNHIHTVFDSNKVTNYEYEHFEGPDDELPPDDFYQTWLKDYKGQTLVKKSKDKAPVANDSAPVSAGRGRLRRNA